MVKMWLTGPEVDAIPPNKRKYVLYNNLWSLRVKGDCSLFLRNVTWDQGEYTCIYLEPGFKFVSLQKYWIDGNETHKVTLTIKGLEPIEVLTVAK